MLNICGKYNNIKQTLIACLEYPLLIEKVNNMVNKLQLISDYMMIDSSVSEEGKYFFTNSNYWNNKKYFDSCIEREVKKLHQNDETTRKIIRIVSPSNFSYFDHEGNEPEGFSIIDNDDTRIKQVCDVLHIDYNRYISFRDKNPPKKIKESFYLKELFA